MRLMLVVEVPHNAGLEDGKPSPYDVARALSRVALNGQGITFLLPTGQQVDVDLRKVVRS